MSQLNSLLNYRFVKKTKPKLSFDSNSSQESEQSHSPNNNDQLKTSPVSSQTMSQSQSTQEYDWSSQLTNESPSGSKSSANGNNKK